jgi:rare lipoprotein A
MYAMTASHRTLPFGTEVRVQNLENGRKAVVRINDRGPFLEGRILDLSYAAAEAIGMVGPGVARVRLEVLGPAGPDAASGIYAVQVGSFRELGNAERLKEEIERAFSPVIIQSFDRGDGLLHRVRVGHANTEQAARDLAQRLRQNNLTGETLVVRLN